MLETMGHLCFGPPWHECDTSLLIDGVPSPPLHHVKGLRQCDSLSPMMFTLIIDVLNSVLQHAMISGILHRITNCHAVSSIPLYVDDVVIFCHPDSEQLHAMHELLRVFGIASDLHANFLNSSTTPIQ